MHQNISLIVPLLEQVAGPIDANHGLKIFLLQIVTRWEYGANQDRYN